MTRRNLAALAAALTLATTGCESLRNSATPAGSDPLAGAPIDSVTSDKLVAYLNKQSDAVTSLRSEKVLIDLKSPEGSLTCNDSDLICAKPRNLSLIGRKLALGEMFNVGSNSEEFWIYNRLMSASDGKFIYCSHSDFERGVAQLPFPFDSDWALQALGMSFYDPNRPYRVTTDEVKQEHSLSYETTTPQGATVTRTVVFAANPMNGSKPQVRRHIIANAQGEQIATAEVKEVATLSAGTTPSGAERYVQVPTEMVLAWPQQKFRMQMELRSPTINVNMPPEQQRAAFSRPEISGVRPVNLTTLQAQYRGATPAELPRRRLIDR